MKKVILLTLILALGFVAKVANADYIFGEPTNLGPNVNTSSRDGLACASADGLSLFFASQRSGGHGGWDLWLTTRAITEDPWQAPVNLGSTVNSSSWETGPDISEDGLKLFIQSNQPGGQGSQDIWVTMRSNITDPWGPPVNLGSPVNSSGDEVGPSSLAGDSTLFFSSNRSGGYGGDDLYIATQSPLSDAWDAPVNLGPMVNTGSTDRAPSISSDGRMLFFHSNRPGGYGLYDLYVTIRSNITDSWSTPMNLGSSVNSSVEDVGPSISDDGRTLFFMSMRSGGFGSFDAWQVSIDPVVDLNGDGVVDGADLSIIADHWGTDNSLCDIGPMPWGDGVVDVQDLIVIADYLSPAGSEEVNVNEQNDGGHIELEQGQILVVTLESNPTTGYSWQQAENQEPYLEQMGQPEFKSSQTGGPPMVGAGGWEIFRFKAISPGKMTLQLVYRRPWEEGVEPVNNFSLNVLIH